jgi:hypothetical protein
MPKRIAPYVAGKIQMRYCERLATGVYCVNGRIPFDQQESH